MRGNIFITTNNQKSQQSSKSENIDFGSSKQSDKNIDFNFYDARQQKLDSLGNENK